MSYNDLIEEEADETVPTGTGFDAGLEAAIYTDLPKFETYTDPDII